jgi:hypothetical protein
MLDTYLSNRRMSPMFEINFIPFFYPQRHIPEAWITNHWLWLENELASQNIFLWNTRVSFKSNDRNNWSQHATYFRALEAIRFLWIPVVQESFGSWFSFFHHKNYARASRSKFAKYLWNETFGIYPPIFFRNLRCA